MADTKQYWGDVEDDEYASYNTADKIESDEINNNVTVDDGFITVTKKPRRKQKVGPRTTGKMNRSGRVTESRRIYSTDNTSQHDDQNYTKKLPTNHHHLPNSNKQSNKYDKLKDKPIPPHVVSESSIRVPFSRCIVDTCRKLPYEDLYQTSDGIESNIYKYMLFSDIDFFNYIHTTLGSDKGGRRKSCFVVYDGYVPHIMKISCMFPEHTFMVHGSGPNIISREKLPRVKELTDRLKKLNDDFLYKLRDSIYVQPEGLTSKTARVIHEKLSHNSDAMIVFISHSPDSRINKSPESIEEFMSVQNNILKNLQPSFASLRFKIPYNRTSITYLDGELRFPIFGAITNTESRLFLKSSENGISSRGYLTREYDAVDYDSKMFRFKVATRKQKYSAWDVFRTHYMTESGAYDQK